MVLDLQAQRLDIVSLEFVVGQATLLQSDEGDYHVVGEMVTEPEEYFGEGFGIAFRQRDTALAERFNEALDRKSTRLNSSHVRISYAVFCLKKKKKRNTQINS